MSRILECFDSRWGKDGVIIEADYSQLEIVALAILSNDKVLQADIKAGRDMHSMSASFLHPEWDYGYIVKEVGAGNSKFVKMRKEAKAPGFLIQYGGGASAMAKNTGLSKTKCKQFIDNYYARYSRIGEWQAEQMLLVISNRVPSNKKSAAGTPLGMSTIRSITGRLYTFYEQETKDYRGNYRTSFSPTQVKNYPVQGFATGDIVPMMLGELHKMLNTFFLKKDIRLVNTVHDSIIIDCKKEAEHSVRLVVRNELEKVNECLHKHFGIVTDMPFHVDVSSGSNWAEAKG